MMMTLIVQVYTRNNDGTIHFVEGDSSAELAGFERCRHDLWGSKAAIALGLNLLPALAQGNLYVEADALSHQANEANILLSHIDLLADQTVYTADFIVERTHNILAAVKRARLLEGGVCIE